MPISLTTINPDEVLRYMGTPPDQAGADLRALVEACAREVISAARPRWAYRVFDLVPEEEGVRLDCGLLLPGEDLKRHLKDCRRAALFCATLSAQVDALIRRAESGDMLRALALDCCAAAAVEEVCDQIEGELQGQFPGCFFPFRFSPGYGDLPLTLQGPLVRGPAPHPPGLSAQPAGRPPEGGTVRQQHPYLDPPQVGDRHSGDRRPSNRSKHPKLCGLSRPRRLPVSKVRWTLWNFLNSCKPAAPCSWTGAWAPCSRPRACP